MRLEKLCMLVQFKIVKYLCFMIKECKKVNLSTDSLFINLEESNVDAFKRIWHFPMISYNKRVSKSCLESRLNKGNIRTMYEIYPKWTMKTPGRNLQMLGRKAQYWQIIFWTNNSVQIITFFIFIFPSSHF